VNRIYKTAEKLKKLGVKDSKLLTPKQRVKLEKEVKKHAVEIHFVEITAREIDELRKRMSLNEVEAMKMCELIEQFKHTPDRIVIDLPDPDGNKFIRRMQKYTDFPCKIIAEHKADVNYPSVSAASIVAKTIRDALVREIEAKYEIKVRTGYSHDQETIRFLEECVKNGKYPEFVRESWDTAKRLRDKKHQKKLSDW
jgi:ribonuclease HII